MACLKDLEGKWRLKESQGFEEYMKELGKNILPKPGVPIRVQAALVGMCWFPSTTRPGALRAAPCGR